MFESLETLRVDRHTDRCFTPASGYGFAATYNLAPLCTAELGQAARAMPVVFTRAGGSGADLPQALMALSAGRNDFLDAEGVWLGDYVPAHFRRYPFILGRLGGGSGGYALMIDPEAPHFAVEEGQGEALFDAEGQPSERVSRARDFLVWLHGQMEQTREQVRRLEEAEVLTERQLTLQQEGAQARVRGLRVVDMERVRALPDATLGAWVRDGVMDLIHAHLLSLGHLQRLDAATLLAEQSQGAMQGPVTEAG